MVVPLVVNAQLSLGADVRVLGQAAQIAQEIVLPVGWAKLGIAHVKLEVLVGVGDARQRLGVEAQRHGDAIGEIGK